MTGMCETKNPCFVGRQVESKSTLATLCSNDSVNQKTRRIVDRPPTLKFVFKTVDKSKSSHIHVCRYIELLNNLYDWPFTCVSKENIPFYSHVWRGCRTVLKMLGFNYDYTCFVPIVTARSILVNVRSK